jgi:hypothetical protein
MVIQPDGKLLATDLAAVLLKRMNMELIETLGSGFHLKPKESAL